MQSDRINISSNAVWEDIVGYSRAVKVGPHIYISGTTALNENGNLIGINDPYLQTIQTIKNIELALNKFGAALENIVRTRIYVKNISDWQIIGEAHGEYFRNIKPATSMVEIKNLIMPEMLVEIEADAVYFE
ncbi:MAG: RidA family protein [Ignavibacteriae bacterium]|jgi:enamine deaminase RidA (YjgF/YER057c/UK114 family)|nr:RidA family protein [Ignavibacteriota bacterium]